MRALRAAEAAHEAPEPQPEPAEEPAPKGEGTRMTAFRLPVDLAEELRGAAKALDADQALIVREALEMTAARSGEPGSHHPTASTPQRTTVGATVPSRRRRHRRVAAPRPSPSSPAIAPAPAPR